MPFVKRAAVATFIFALPLGGCSGVLDPRGPIGASEKLILFDSLTIMLAIVIPVIVATLGIRLVVPGLERARVLLARMGLFGHSGAHRLGDPGARHHFSRGHRLVWLARARPLCAPRLEGEAGRSRSRFARLEMAVHLSR